MNPSVSHEDGGYGLVDRRIGQLNSGCDEVTIEIVRCHRMPQTGGGLFSALCPENWHS
jgi:hypothetical protein